MELRTRIRVLKLRAGRLFSHAPFTLTKDVYPGYEIGDYTYGVPDILPGAVSGKVTIGRFCSFATGVKIMLGGVHHTNFVTTSPLWLFADFVISGRPHPPCTTTRGDIRIGHDVWVATDAMILSGVTIGSGAVVAARSVVTRDVPPYAVIAGAPARVVRYRFSADDIAFLLELAWWDWSIDKIRESADLLLSGDGLHELKKEYTCHLCP